MGGMEDPKFWPESSKPNDADLERFTCKMVNNTQFSQQEQPLHFTRIGGLLFLYMEELTGAGSSKRRTASFEKLTITTTTKKGNLNENVVWARKCAAGSLV